jgi:hypothetical protein
LSQSSHNFGFLESHPTLAKLATLAEKYFADGLNTALANEHWLGEGKRGRLESCVLAKAFGGPEYIR